MIWSGSIHQRSLADYALWIHLYQGQEPVKINGRKRSQLGENVLSNFYKSAKEKKKQQQQQRQQKCSKQSETKQKHSQTPKGTKRNKNTCMWNQTAEMPQLLITVLIQ